jgi:hypothetical protein
VRSARADGGGGGGRQGGGGVVWYGICKYCSGSKQTSRDLPSTAAVVSRAEHGDGELPHLLRANSRGRQRGREPNSPTLYQATRYQDQADAEAASAWTVAATRLHTNSLPQSYEITRTHISLSWLPFPSPLIAIYSQLASDPHQTSSLQPFICLCHVASHSSVPSMTFILLDSPLSPTPWVVAPRAACAWGNTMRRPIDTMAGAAARDADRAI